MQVQDAQQEMRTVFLGGSIGQAVSGSIWLISVVLATIMNERAGLVSLFLGGMFIFPLTQLVIRILGRPASLKSGNPLEGLARQVAFIVPLCLPVIAAAALYNINWYYPAFMIVVGAHYLPFIFLYGMRHYGFLAAALIAGGVAIGWLLPHSFTPGGWFTAVVLIAFSVIAWRTTPQERPAVA